MIHTGLGEVWYLFFFCLPCVISVLLWTIRGPLKGVSGGGLVITSLITSVLLFSCTSWQGRSQQRVGEGGGDGANDIERERASRRQCFCERDPMSVWSRLSFCFRKQQDRFVWVSFQSGSWDDNKRQEEEGCWCGAKVTLRVEKMEVASKQKTHTQNIYR